MISSINSLKASNPGYTIVVTGHSLGGGIASIAASSLAALGNKVTVYTYGEPRNGNDDFTTYIQSLIPTSSYFRVTHANDGVPQIPPKVLGYRHHGTEYWEKPLGIGSVSASNTYKCAGEEPVVSAANPLEVFISLTGAEL